MHPTHSSIHPAPAPHTRRNTPFSFSKSKYEKHIHVFTLQLQTYSNTKWREKQQRIKWTQKWRWKWAHQWIVCSVQRSHSHSGIIYTTRHTSYAFIAHTILIAQSIVYEMKYFIRKQTKKRHEINEQQHTMKESKERKSQQHTHEHRHTATTD